jgi:diguanylate cyclase (GGDEF)-like protein
MREEPGLSDGEEDRRSRVGAPGEKEVEMPGGRDPESEATLAARLERRIVFERTLSEISARLTSARTGRLDRAIEAALGVLGAFFGVDRSYVFRFGADARTMSNTHEWVAQGITREAPRLQNVPVETFPWLMAELSGDRPVHIPRIEELPPGAAAEKAEFEREGIRSIVIVPMRWDGRLVGFVGFDAVRRQVDWTEEYVVGLRLFAQIVVGSLESRELATRLSEMAFQDPLTGLPNRKLLGDRLDRAIVRARRHRRRIGVILLDIDDFKLVNDRFGHDTGDRLLREVARRLATVVRDSDTLARLGGDEFVVVLEDVDEVPLEAVAARILEVLGRPVDVGCEPIVIHPSLGLVHGQGGAGLAAGELLRAADVAMYAAKSSGKNRWAVYTPAMDLDVGNDPGLRFQLGRALADGELRLFLQPRFDLARGARTGAEALVRWQHPRRGLLLPADFLPFAERTSLICGVDRWVLGRAIARAYRNGSTARPISVNLSARALRDRDPFEELLALLAGAPGGADRVELELTESVLLEDLPGAVERLGAIKRAAPGVRIAIDDFGRGYSSLQYLHRLPIDTLKIDRSFVSDLVESDRRSVAIVRAIVELGHNLGLRVVGEGVETPDQARWLRELGCDEGQGHLFGAPVSEERFESTGEAASPV